MKRYAPYAAFVAGLAIVIALQPWFNAAQPRGTRLTRHDAVPIADAAARSMGIPVDDAWSVLSWGPSYRLEKELNPNPENPSDETVCCM